MKTAKIYVYGIIDSYQDSDAQNWGYVNLTSIRDQVINQGEFDELEVHIHSEGGVVSEGFAIHDYLRTLGKPVTTICDGVCASIATVVLLAGDKRIGTEHSSPFIHNPWGMVGGDKTEIQKYADQLEELEDQISEFYASKTKLSKEEALVLMKEETSFSADDALANGFLTEIRTVMRAVALLNPKKKKMPETNLSEEKVQGMFDGLLEKFKNILKPEAPKNKIVQDANGVEIDFSEVEDDAQEVVGDKATVDGAGAEGEYIMPSGETYVFAAGELTEIKDKEEEEGVEALQDEITDLKGKLEAAEAEAVNLQKKLDAEILLKDGALNSIKDIEKDFKALTEISSGFKYDPKKKNFVKTEGSTRRVLKEA